ncbi:MAG: hypothetical protein HYR64_00240 [Fimbriimonas ginsengisoli]|uniref:PH domain-containing protein n=1 Tax=Fimbriimonas ginsengisoli TaxID=1005039 RepID=A0A931PSP5_FIMGI|nr:hypothetical protein [Fimbriimonas ginsengisoli]
MTGANEESEALSWRVRLSEREPRKALVVVAAAFVTLCAGAFWLRQPLVGVVGAVVVLGATAEFLVGASYRLDLSGATSACLLSVSTIEWKDVRRAIVELDGLRLSPLETPGRRESFRGVFLRYGAENREAVIGAARRWGGPNVRFHEH